MLPSSLSSSPIIMRVVSIVALLSTLLNSVNSFSSHSFTTPPSTSSSIIPKSPSQQHYHHHHTQRVPNQISPFKSQLYMSSEEDSETFTGSTYSQSDDAAKMMKEEQQEPATAPVVKCPDCDQCDGSGRIMGGIATVIPWFIKAYRPCPVFIERGGNYVRSGQPLDEIAFGRRGEIEDADEYNS